MVSLLWLLLLLLLLALLVLCMEKYNMLAKVINSLKKSELDITKSSLFFDTLLVVRRILYGRLVLKRTHGKSHGYSSHLKLNKLCRWAEHLNRKKISSFNITTICTSNQYRKLMHKHIWSYLTRDKRKNYYEIQNCIF